MKRSRKTKDGITALYERLSRDDEQEGDSNSIVHQKEMLEEYARKNGYQNLAHYTDDGWSGASFDRPDWNRLISDVKADKVTTVIVKDLSRIGRDHLQVGFFTDVLFREKDVHFIAVGNGIDSDHQETSEFAPFLNIMNEWYVRDTSKKIKSVLNMRGNSGKAHTSNVPCYGYVKDPENPDHWIIDEEAAAVVRRIFKMCVDGKGPWEIARILEQDKVERPSYYWAKKGIGNNLISYDAEHPYAWQGTTVAEMLLRPEYVGDTVNFRTYKNSYKDKRVRLADKEDWVVFHDTQEPIVDRETWNIVQRIRKNVRKTYKTGEANVLTGLVFCADCGAIMLYNHRHGTTGYTTYFTASGEKISRIRKPTDGYQCSAYTKKHTKVCCSHSIPTATLNKLILETIRDVCSYAVENEDQFVSMLLETSKAETEQLCSNIRMRLKKNEQQLDELELLIQRIYEDNVSGKLSDKHFNSMLQRFEADQVRLEEAVSRDTEELQRLESESSNVEKFLELTRRYTSFEELTPAMINEFVSKVLVHKAVGRGAHRVMQVDVYLNFIGKFTVPHEPEVLSEEEKEAKRIAEEKLERKRATNRAYMKRIRQANQHLYDQDARDRKAAKLEAAMRQDDDSEQASPVEADAADVSNETEVKSA